MSPSPAFDPNKMTFSQGIQRIKEAVANVELFRAKRIVTSRDAGVDKVLDSLRVKSVPTGFAKFQLPVYFEGGPGAQFFLSIGAPDTDVPRHSHDEGDGLRFVVSGSILHEGKELREGDWMFIPKGTPYTAKIGKHGATLFYCYQCCCAP